MAQVVYANTTEGSTEGSSLDGRLFHGTKFWFSHRVPMRRHFIEEVKSNGGEVVPLEKQADIMIVDHMRKDVAPGTHSWTYIDQSVKRGALEDLHDHIAGPPVGTARTVGSATRPASGVRKPYTTEDDRVLYDWVTSCSRKGGKILGNEIYKQLEAINPRHPWQSWRDRWVKNLSQRPPPASRSDNPAPSRPSEERQDGQPGGNTATSPRRSRQARSPSYPRVEVVVTQPSFTEDDVRLLLGMAADIENIHPERCEEAWVAFASDYPGHSARQWETFYKERVLPIHQSKVKKLKIKAAAKQTLPSGTKPVRNNTPKRSRNMVGQFTSSPLFAGNGNHETPTDRQTTKSPTLASMVARNGSQESSRSPTFTPASPTLPTQFRERSVESNPVCLTPSQSKLNSDRLLTVSAAYAQLNQTLAAPNEDEQRTPSSEARHISEHTASATRGSPITANGVHIDLRSQTRQLRSEGLASRSELEVEPTERSPDYLREQDREMNYLISLPRETSTTPSPQTRKRILVKDEPGSSPIKPTTPHSSKRSRLQRILNGDLEIPSTPDKLFSSVPPYTPTPIRTRNYRLELDQGGEESEVELGVAASETLSEPEQSASDTQRYFDNAMELPNFDLPERPGGWDDDLSSRCDDDPEPEPGPEPDAYEKDTQAIMNAKAPVLDFAVPEPDSGWDSVLPSSPPILQPSSHPLPPPPTAEEINARLDAWIDSHITTGISEDDVLLALKCTTMHTGLAEVVLKSLVGGKGVPRDVRGIWTEEDDRDLEASDGRVLKALERKHGKEGFDRRWVFLEDYRGEGDWGGVRRCI